MVRELLSREEWCDGSIANGDTSPGDDTTPAFSPPPSDDEDSAASSARASHRPPNALLALWRERIFEAIDVLSASGGVAATRRAKDLSSLVGSRPIDTPGALEAERQ